jgi:hypothetical protein
MLDYFGKKAFNACTMSEQISESDFRDVPKNMPAEANAASSLGHLLHWAHEHHLVHFDKEGRMTVDGNDDLKDVSTDTDNRSEDAEKPFRLEAGVEGRDLPPTAA